MFKIFFKLSFALLILYSFTPSLIVTESVSNSNKSDITCYVDTVSNTSGLLTYASTLSPQQYRDRSLAERYESEKYRIAQLQFWLNGNREIQTKRPTTELTTKNMERNVSVGGNIITIIPMTLREKRINKRSRLGLERFDSIRSAIAEKKYKFFFQHEHLNATKVRPSGAIRKINDTMFYYIFTPGFVKVALLFIEHNFELRVCGGAVRDLLNGTVPEDIDFATDATPKQMEVMFKLHDFNLIHTKVQEHGIFTVVVDSQKFEITSLRREICIDGKIDQITFISSWEEDASRRDLTVNAMFLGLDGLLYDYHNGYEDLKKRKVVFVGDPDQRIQEDYLRILRYFRFFAKITADPNAYDTKTITAIKKNAKNLDKVFGRRVWKELQKILRGNYAKEIMEKIFDLGISKPLGLGKAEKLDRQSFEYMYELKEKYNFQYRPITYIGALLQTDEQIREFNLRMLLTDADLDLLKFVVRFKKKGKTDINSNRRRGRRRIPRKQSRY